MDNLYFLLDLIITTEDKFDQILHKHENKLNHDSFPLQTKKDLFLKTASAIRNLTKWYGMITIDQNTLEQVYYKDLLVEKSPDNTKENIISFFLKVSMLVVMAWGHQFEKKEVFTFINSVHDGFQEPLVEQIHLILVNIWQTANTDSQIKMSGGTREKQNQTEHERNLETVHKFTRKKPILERFVDPILAILGNIVRLSIFQAIFSGTLSVVLSLIHLRFNKFMPVEENNTQNSFWEYLIGKVNPNETLPLIGAFYSFFSTKSVSEINKDISSLSAAWAYEIKIHSRLQGMLGISNTIILTLNHLMAIFSTFLIYYMIQNRKLVLPVNRQLWGMYQQNQLSLSHTETAKKIRSIISDTHTVKIYSVYQVNYFNQILESIEAEYQDVLKKLPTGKITEILDAVNLRNKLACLIKHELDRKNHSITDEQPIVNKQDFVAYASAILTQMNQSTLAVEYYNYMFESIETTVIEPRCAEERTLSINTIIGMIHEEIEKWKLQQEHKERIQTNKVLNNTLITPISVTNENELEQKNVQTTLQTMHSQLEETVAPTTTNQLLAKFTYVSTFWDNLTSKLTFSKAQPTPQQITQTEKKVEQLAHDSNVIAQSLQNATANTTDEKNKLQLEIQFIAQKHHIKQDITEQFKNITKQEKIEMFFTGEY